MTHQNVEDIIKDLHQEVNRLKSERNMFKANYEGALELYKSLTEKTMKIYTVVKVGAYNHEIICVCTSEENVNIIMKKLYDSIDTEIIYSNEFDGHHTYEVIVGELDTPMAELSSSGGFEQITYADDWEYKPKRRTT